MSKHFKAAQEHLKWLESKLLNVKGEDEINLRMQLVELQLETARLELEFGISDSEPAAMPTPPARKVAAKLEQKTTLVPTASPSSYELYDHVNIKDEHLFSEGKCKLLYVIGKKFYQLEGAALESRLLESASNILRKSVASLNALHFKDGNQILEEIKAAAIANGSFVEGAR